MMRRGRLALAAVELVLIAAGLVACASSARSSGPGTISNAASASVTRTHMTSWATSDGTSSKVVVSGAIGDFGTAIRNAEDTRLQLALSHGSFQLDIADLEDKMKAAFAKLAVNQHSCSAEASTSGTAAVVSGSGTREYAKIRGTLDLTMTLDEVYHPGACRETAAYASQVIILTGWGTLHR